MVNERKNDQPKDARAWQRPAPGDHGDDAALWDMLAEIGEVKPPRDFVARTAAYVEERGRREASTVQRNWWRWGAVVAAAAASVVLAFVFRPHTDPKPANNAHIGTVAVMPASMSEAALTAYEIDDLEEINQDWFGG